MRYMLLALTCCFACSLHAAVDRRVQLRAESDLTWLIAFALLAEVIFLARIGLFRLRDS